MAQDDEHEPDAYDDEAPRSMFSALWFRALIVILVLGVVAAVAVPYVLDRVGTQTPKSTAAVKPAASPTPTMPAPTTTATPTQAAPTPQSPSAPTAAATEVTTPDAAKPAPSKTQTAKAQPQKAQAATPDAAKSDIAKADVAKPDTTKPESPKAETPAVAGDKPAAAPTTTTKATAKAAKPAAKAATVAKATAAGPYWVQVGAFRDEAAAKRVADKLREQKYQVQESVKSVGGAKGAPSASPGTDRYNVFVSGMAPAELNTKLTAKGLASDPVAGGVVVTPSLPLRDAVALSKDLAAEGLKVQVRRASGASASASAPKASSGGGETLHRVRVGSFPDRAAAEAAARELEAKGYKGYIARGNR